jgi:phage terminase large subunit
LSRQAYLSLKLEKLRRKAERRSYDSFYVPYGGCRDIYETKVDEVVISGPAGTGKSRACLEKLHRLALDYPHSRHLIVRKTRTSLSESGLQTFEDWVLKRSHPLVTGGPARRNRVKYTYVNGSEIYAGGMDKPGRIMSTEYDTIFVQEAIELNLSDWEALTTRLRNYRVPYQQLMADTNPAFPLHWLRQRCNIGTTECIESTHRDNPRLWNHETQEWTVEGVGYINRLMNLTGTQRQRLFEGKWVQTEGVVYDEFTDANLTDKEPDSDHEIELAIDDGYVDPRAILFIQYTPTEVLVFDEIYHSRHLPEVCISEVIDRCEDNDW